MTDLVEFAPRGAATKVLAVLDAFGTRGGAIPLAELADRAALPKSTTHRMLCFLRGAEFVESLNGCYYLSDKVSLLSAGQPEVLSPGARARLMPFLTELYEVTHEVVQLVVRTGSTGQVIERIHGHRSAPLAARRGDIQPLHRTAAGKALLADGTTRADTADLRLGESRRTALTGELASVHASGIAYERGDWQPELCGVAAAVRGPKQEVLAAISVVGPVGRFRPEAIATRIRKIASAATRELDGAVPRSPN